jgi:hypothetical protein
MIIGDLNMKKILATLVASAAFVVSAYAGEVEGVVKSFDEATKTVTLEDAQVFTLATDVAVEGIVAGAKVKVTFDDATKAASAVVVSTEEVAAPAADATAPAADAPAADAAPAVEAAPATDAPAAK